MVQLSPNLYHHALEHTRDSLGRMNAQDLALAAAALHTDVVHLMQTVETVMK